MSGKHTNALIDESSPYLLQHAHNPVAWQAWRPNVLNRAVEENKLLLVSIGYAACHWCHVMEKECFEDEDAAAVMNRHFIPIKVDREERPDVDHIYMDALQLMTGSGGWPLNVVALPDGRPFWGATYVKKDDWIQVLRQLADLYETDPAKVEGYAQNLAQGIQELNQVTHSQDTDLLSKEKLKQLVADWSSHFDTFLGGYKRAPKFMMPVSLNFLLHYGHSNRDKDILEYVNITLTRMAYGGIFDQIAGGFARYSVDVKWHVPHFEKMLYDNAQLISLYSKAFAATRNPLYQDIAERCIGFVKSELMSPDFGFYSSLDADSLNKKGILEEGAYYVWYQDELKQYLGDDFALFTDYYNINKYGHWEEGKYVLIRDATDEEIGRKHGLTTEQVRTRIASCRSVLMKERAKRERPRLDNKILASWNGLMLKGLVDASRYIGNREFLKLALKNAVFLSQNLIESNGKLYHNHADEKNRIPGYLEDYASIVEAYLDLYQLCFEEAWLILATKLMDYCLDYFFDQTSRLFYFTSREEPYVVRRTLETTDNVIPASNSIMAKNLFTLSKYFPEGPYGAMARQMLLNMQDQIERFAQSHSNWLQLLLLHLETTFELAITGPEAMDKARQFFPEYLPQLTLAASSKASELPLLKGRFLAGETLLYLCTHGHCKLPSDDPGTILKQLISQ